MTGNGAAGKGAAGERAARKRAVGAIEEGAGLRTGTGTEARRLRDAVTRLARQLRRQAGTDLTPTQAAALASIERHGPVTIGDLAAHEQVSAPTATNAVSKLEAGGLVRRLRDAADRRVCRVELTAAGTKELEVSRNRKTEWLAARLAALSPDDVARLAPAIDVLEQLASPVRR